MKARETGAIPLEKLMDMTYTTESVVTRFVLGNVEDVVMP
jgi:hypothetical protein